MRLLGYARVSTGRQAEESSQIADYATLQAICDKLNGRGYRSRIGKRFAANQARKMSMSPIAGG